MAKFVLDEGTQEIYSTLPHNIPALRAVEGFSSTAFFVFYVFSG